MSPRKCLYWICASSVHSISLILLISSLDLTWYCNWLGKLTLLQINCVGLKILGTIILSGFGLSFGSSPFFFNHFLCLKLISCLDIKFLTKDNFTCLYMLLIHLICFNVKHEGHSLKKYQEQSSLFFNCKNSIMRNWSSQ